MEPKHVQETQQAEDPEFQEWLRKKGLEEQPKVGGAELLDTQPLPTLQLEDSSGDPWYDLGSAFLGLPARASRDGDLPGEVVGTAVHVELFGYSAEPPYLAVAFEPATGSVLDCRSISFPGAFEAYEEVMWGLIGSYMEALDCRTVRTDSAAKRHKPANISTTDSALADYMFGLLQGCGCGVVCIDPTQRVQWPSAGLEGLLAKPDADADADADTPAAQAGEADATPQAPMVRAVQAHVVATLVSSGRAAAVLEDGAAAATKGCGALSLDHAEAEEARSSGAAAGLSAGATNGPLVLLGACHYPECAKVALRRALKRCSACKRMMYCSTECQRSHWDAGHRTECKDIQQMGLQQAKSR